MLLCDIGKNPDSTLTKVNRQLESVYGIKISKDISGLDLQAVMEKVEDEITELKIRGEDARSSSEISMRLLILEGLRSIRDSVLTELYSPDFEKVISGMCDFVVKDFTLCGCDDSAFEESMKDAMKAYRSSKYRFPDELVEQRVREAALKKITMQENPQMPLEENKYNDEFEWSLELDKNEQLKKAGVDDEGVPLVKDPKTGKMVPDPWKKQAADRKKGIYMKEHANLVKNLRLLLETEVSQAEVMIAAKDFADELQEMVEKIGRLQNEDLPPVTDQMRKTYGTDSASAFQTQIYGALQGVMNALYTAKEQVDNSVENLATTGQVTAEIDMDKDLETDADVDAEVDAEVDLDNIEDEFDNIDFEADEEDNTEPLGRSMKESREALKKKISEMKNILARARKLKESKKNAA